MPIEIEVVRNGRAVVMKYPAGALSVEDVASVARQLELLLEQVPLPIHNISEMSQLQGFPPNTLGYIRKFQRLLTHPKMGVSVVVTTKPFIRAMMNAIVRVFPYFNIRVVTTMSDAWAEIDKLIAARVTD